MERKAETPSARVACRDLYRRIDVSPKIRSLLRVLAALALFAAILLTARWSLSQALANVVCDGEQHAASETACDRKGWLGLRRRGAGWWILLAAALPALLLAGKLWTAVRRRKSTVAT